MLLPVQAHLPQPLLALLPQAHLPQPLLTLLKFIKVLPMLILVYLVTFNHQRNGRCLIGKCAVMTARL